MNKSILSNLIAAAVVVVGLFVEWPYQVYVLNTGLFALSGGITNWLAVYMLFERVPGIYGSGVIPLRFEEFKLGIRQLIMEQFFQKADLEEFFHGAGDISEKMTVQLKKAIDELDLDAAFESLLDVIMASSFGSMVGMLGGRDALKALNAPFVEKMREFFGEQLTNGSFQEQIQTALSSAMDDEVIRSKLEFMIDDRLNQMTPNMVKEIIQQMIRKHLGWLVVWGCVFGGLIGLVVTVATAN
ncbi:MAG: DUF445 domain-containing protein [SAR86 cluster bacterium]|uniref:DUF445 domain-containing protein n=1 Tax=SAR86 cluster bacterium TaxID=2030880 RepID=A0A2A4XER5_9GAMM|nr:MAG: DUF445 domain-containing protein [SAR86 cluster bacterium]